MVSFALMAGVLYARNASVLGTPLYERTDEGANSILIEQARRFTLLTGIYSHTHVNHPGPAFLYPRAWTEQLFWAATRWVPTAFNGQLIGVYALSGAFAAFVVVIAYGWTPSARGVLAALAVVFTFAYLHPPAFSSDWLSYSYVPVYLAFVVAVASVAAGRVDRLPGSGRGNHIADPRAGTPVPDRAADSQHRVVRAAAGIRGHGRRSPRPGDLLRQLLLLVGARDHAAGSGTGRGRGPAVGGERNAGHGNHRGDLPRLRTRPATSILFHNTAFDPALPQVVRVLAARSAGKPIVIQLKHGAWSEMAGFLVQAERASVCACVADPHWKFMVSSQFICTPQQVAHGAAYMFTPASQAPPGVLTLARLGAIVVTGPAGRA